MRAMKRYRCPRCGDLVGEDELAAVETGDGAGDGAILSAAPPKHLSVETSIEGVSTATTLRFKRVNPLALFMIPFTCMWGGVSLSGLYGPQIAKGEFDLERSLFGIPFLLGSLAHVAFCVFLLFGKHVLKLSAGQGRYFVGVGPFGMTKRFRYGRDTKVVEESAVVRGRRGGTYTARFLQVENPGEPGGLSICRGLDDDAIAYAAAMLRRECRR